MFGFRGLASGTNRILPSGGHAEHEMPSTKDHNPNSSGGLPGFHSLAAARGEGLHPLLAAALAKTGSVAGPPLPSEQSDDNVVRLDFGRGRPPVKDETVQSG